MTRQEIRRGLWPHNTFIDFENGEYIYSASRRSGELQIWKMAAEGGAALIQVSTQGAWNPLESADGKYLFYTKPMNPGVWRMPVSGGQEQRVFSDAVAAIGSAYSPTRNGIYFIRAASSAGKQTLNGLDPTLLPAAGRLRAEVDVHRAIGVGDRAGVLANTRKFFAVL